MQDKRQPGAGGFDRAQGGPVDDSLRPLLQMQVADGDGKRIGPAFGGKARGLGRVGPARRAPPDGADKAQFRLDRHACGMGEGRDFCRAGDVFVQGQHGAVEHDRGEARVDGAGALLGAVPVIEMGHHGDRRLFAQGAEHRAQYRQRRVSAAAGAGLQDDGGSFRLGGGDEGQGIFPAQHDKARHGGAARQRRAQHVGQRHEGHLNLAIMSLIPGIVSI